MIDDYALITDWVFTFIIHRYIVSLSLPMSTSTMSVPPDTSSLQVPVGKSDSVLAPGAMASDTTVSASSSGPVLPASYLVRDSEQITASEASLVLQEGPRASSFPCWQKLFLRPKTSLRPRMSLSLQTFPKILRSYHVKLRRPTLDHTPAYPAAVTLPLHSTPMDEAFGVPCTRITWNAVCIASIWKVTTQRDKHKHSPHRPSKVYTCNKLYWV